MAVPGRRPGGDGGLADRRRAGTRAALAIPLASRCPRCRRRPPSPPFHVAAPALVFFAKAGAFVFGSGLAIVPFLYGGVVREHRWLTDQQFLDAGGGGHDHPGPVVITVAFIGYLVRGFGGMVAAAAGVFLPVFLFVVLPRRCSGGTSTGRAAGLRGRRDRRGHGRHRGGGLRAGAPGDRRLADGGSGPGGAARADALARPRASGDRGRRPPRTLPRPREAG